MRGMETWLKANGIPVTYKTCGVYVEEILNEWHQERVADIDKWITAELMGLAKVEREAWEAWERSKKDRTKSVTRKRGKMLKGGNIETTSVESFDEVLTGAGDPRFLDIAKECRLQRLQYLTRGTFGKEGDTINNYNTQQIIQIGVVKRERPQEVVEPPTIDVQPVQE